MSIVEQPIPQARREGLVVQDLGDEVLVYDTTSHKAHCLNRTAALVWKACDGIRSAGDIARVVEADLHSSVEEKTVWYALSQLDKLHLLTENVTLPVVWAGMSRREFMRKAGIAAAVSVPVIISLTAPTKAQAASCLPSGQLCTSSAQCCSGVCSGGICL